MKRTRLEKEIIGEGHAINKESAFLPALDIRLVSLAQHGGVLLALDNVGDLYELSRETNGVYRFIKVAWRLC